ncbi:purine nucleoside phosphorylase [Drosophila sulfurigaster albostrigata]|uniref:purine nucleoside phosphorylase n=1 Tax=Drosophila sulfurigaster albostrigata TaxID=89887 RepID=UPI002D2188F3|nr:purine nucleoside phosphorylase [Drosophila sulfurigaster albostrigata]
MGEPLTDSKEVKIGIIGESGLDTPLTLNDRKECAVCTPFGKPSDIIIEGDIENVKCALLSRSGRLHDIMPSNVNYRANIWAMRKLGCTHILATNTVSSLRDYIHQGDVVVPHDIIDNTTKREQTFYDGAVGSPFGVCHLPMYPVFCERTRNQLVRAANLLEIATHSKGIVITLEGPRYSTIAENNLFRSWGADILSMTLCPEAALAKEAGILYASFCFVTNKECWCVNQQVANTHEIIYAFKKNLDKIQNILINTIKGISQENWSEEILKAKMLVCSNFSNRNQ